MAGRDAEAGRERVQKRKKALGGTRRSERGEKGLLFRELWREGKGFATSEFGNVYVGKKERMAVQGLAPRKGI